MHAEANRIALAVSAAALSISIHLAETGVPFKREKLISAKGTRAHHLSLEHEGHRREHDKPFARELEL
jgi:hypothetical protein